MNKTIIADANMFYHTFNILTSKMDEGILNQNQMNMALIVPATVNGSLACELYMKSMLATIPRKHKLNDLFDLLDGNVKKFITTIMVDIGKNKDASYDENRFMNELGQYGDSFIEWRYFYENEPTIDINFIENLLAVLKGTVSAVDNGIDFSNIDFKFSCQYGNLANQSNQFVDQICEGHDSEKG